MAWGAQGELSKYQDVFSRSGGGSYESGEGSTSYSSDSSSSDKHYSSRVPGFYLKDFQEMQLRMTSGVEAIVQKVT